MLEVQTDTESIIVNSQAFIKNQWTFPIADVYHLITVIKYIIFSDSRFFYHLPQPPFVISEDFKMGLYQ